MSLFIVGAICFILGLALHDPLNDGINRAILADIDRVLGGDTK